MTEHITSILQWLIPSGGLGAVIVWLTNKTLRSTRTAKEVHETYKVLYEDIGKTLIELQNENKRLYAITSRLEKAVSKASSCRYYSDCPINNELSKHETGNRARKRISQGQPAERQRKRKNGEDAKSDGDTGSESGNETDAFAD